MKKKSLFVLIIISIFNLVSCSEAEENTEVQTEFEVISAQKFHDLIIDTDDPQILDVRTPQEYSSGNIEGAVNINIYDSNFEERINELDKSKPVFVYCRSGSRSNKASKILTENGFTMVYDLKGGITSWNLQNFKVPPDNTKSENQGGMTIEAYDKLVSNKDKLVLVDFNAEWCAPCKKLSPILDKIADDHPNKVELIKLDVDENPVISKSMRIQGLPTLKLYKNGEEVWQYLGLTSEDKIVSKINANI